MDLKKTRASRKRVAEAYASHNPKDLIIRDLLALDRTTLANERTILGYIRTSFVVGGSGLTLMKLFHEEPFMVGLGVVMLPFSLVIFLFGVRRFFRTRRALLNLNEHPDAIER